MRTPLLLIIFGLLLSSCTAPREVLQITPEAPEGHYAMGREYISLSSDSIEVELGFDGILGEQLVFDFEVINRTPYELSINPSDFFYVLLDSAMADSSKFPPRMALHPERVLHHYDEALEDKVEEKRTNSFLGILNASISILVGTTGFIATDNPGYIADAIFNSFGTANDLVSQNKELKTHMELITEEKEAVKDEIFRNCTLPPGKVMSGYVFFPKHSDAEYYMFCYPIDRQMFQFVYHQSKVYRYD